MLLHTDVNGSDGEVVPGKNLCILCDQGGHIDSHISS